MRFFGHLYAFLWRPVGLFTRNRLRSTQGGRLYTAQDWVPGGLRGACAGRS